MPVIVMLFTINIIFFSDERIDMCWSGCASRALRINVSGALLSPSEEEFRKQGTIPEGAMLLRIFFLRSSRVTLAERLLQ